MKDEKSVEISGEHGATCRELLNMINDYVDGGADPAICKELESHLAGCNPCRVVVDNVRKTITLFRNGEPCELPSRFHDQLHKLLRERWASGHGKASTPPPE